MSSNDATTSVGTASEERPSRIARWDEIYDPRKGTTVYRKTNDTGPTKHQKKIKKDNPILIVRRKFNSRGQPTSTEVDIKNEKLAGFLQSSYKGIEGLDLHRQPPRCNSKLLALSAPLISARLQSELASKSADKELVEALETACTYVNEDFGSVFSSRDALLQDSEEPYISFDLLWTLFRPGRLLYTYDENTEQGQILEAQSFSIGSSAQTREIYAEVISHMVLHDGKRFGKGPLSFAIPEFTGARKLRDLAVYPLDLYPMEQDLRRQALARGRKFVEMIQQGCTFHELVGRPAIPIGCTEESSGSNIHHSSVLARVMIDPQMYRSRHGTGRINPPVKICLNPTRLDEEEHMLCTPIVTGFSFTGKRWGGFALDRLTAVNRSNKPFDSLVLEPHTKALVHSMVKQHREGASNFDDIVQGKGRGLVGLLCGPPGCGKTLTAEAVAEATKSPLYTLSAGELGTSPGSVESKLDDVLGLAERWKAVVLLDEADVFLAQRDSSNIMRNALVSVFLRKLEYYQGILILTTNLITQCDVAFESRTHFTIHYPPLSFQSRLQIWGTFISQTSGKEKVTNKEINELVAHSFATGEGAQLAKSHIDTVLKVTRDWEKAKKSGQDLTTLGNDSGFGSQLTSAPNLTGLTIGAALGTIALLTLRRAGWI